MKKYHDDQTMKDDDDTGGTGGLPQACDCGSLFEVSEGLPSVNTPGKMICRKCSHSEYVENLVDELEQEIRSAERDPDLITDKTF